MPDKTLSIDRAALRQFTRLAFDHVDQSGDLANPLAADQPILSQMTPQRVYVLRALPHQQIACTEDCGTCLSRFALDRDEPHRRSLGGFADRFGIGSIILLPLHERLHKGGRNQPHIMAQPANLPRPVMRSAARFHRNKASRNQSAT